MIVTITYPKKSDIAKTNPLIRALFFNCIRDAITDVMNAHLVIELSKVRFVESVMIVDDFKLDFNYGQKMTTHGACRTDIKLTVKNIFPLAYRSINKFESLLDMYGGTSPAHMFSATCFGEMEV